MGKCQYVLARDCSFNEFEILVQNIPCGAVNTLTCSKSAVVRMNGTDVMLGRAGLVTVDGVRVTNFPLSKTGKGSLVSVLKK